MKTKIIILIAMLFLILSNINAQDCSGSTKCLDKKYGFRDIKFETNVKDIQDLVFMFEKKDQSFYNKKSDNLSIGDYELESITYIFYKGILYKIVLETKGYINSKGVLKVLTAQYGDGIHNNEYIPIYLWMGRNVTLFYNENSITHNALIAFSCNSISKQIEKDKAISDKSASKDL